MEQQKEKLNNWHLSRYNIFSTKKLEEGKISCVNLFKGTYSETGTKNLEELKNLKDIEDIENKFKNFIRNGIIVNFDEREYIKSLLLMNYNKKSKITIIIAPTLACNFNCPYCFENHTNKNKMNLEIQNKIIDFIKKILISSKKKELNIIWFGGEPLLCLEIIEYISKSLIFFCNENKINYSSGMLSNGYFFNKKSVEILNNCKLNRIQITLDGLEKSHDLTRHLSNGQGSFKQIIDNLNSIKFNGIISIRHSIYNNNKHEVEELKKLIEEIKNKTGNFITYYTAPVINNPGEKRESSIEYLDINDSIIFELERRKRRIPSFKIHYCDAPSLFFFGIGPEGELYKCWEDFGFKDRIYGNVDSWDLQNPIKTATNPDLLMKYINSSGIWDNEECYNCVWLPICAGGCPSKRFFCNMKCLPYVPYRYNTELFIEKIKEYNSY